MAILAFPIAIPSYIMAYIYAELFDRSGPIYASGYVPAFLLPDLFSIPGLAWILSISLYPYVYLAACAGFALRNEHEVRAAQSLGKASHIIFWRILLPKARPAIVAGLALVIMESLADFGAADFLQINTLTVAIFKSWHSFGNVGEAAYLSLWLIIIALSLVCLERYSRDIGSQYASNLAVKAHAMRLDVPLGVKIIIIMSLVILCCIGFLIPVLTLIVYALSPQMVSLPVGSALIATTVLAVIGGIVAAIVAMLIALGKQFRIIQMFLRVLAMVNYAQAGPVLALGAVLGALSISSGISPYFSFFVLIWVYLCRFISAPTEQMIAGLDRVPPNIHHSANSLGINGLNKIMRVDLPLILPAIFAGALFVTIEIVKELPATLILRPFGWDTLALLAYFYAKDEALSATALPALLICIISIIPVAFFSNRVRQSTQ